MAYCALSFEVPAGAADAWSDALLEAGASSVDLADPEAGTSRETAIYGEPGLASPGRWPVTRVTALFADAAAAGSALAAAAASLAQHAPVHALAEVPEQDWVRSTQAQFAPLQVAERLWIVPSWATAVDPHAVNLVLDPGLAFGTGSHPTTRLCLAWLAEASLAGANLLDYGCGSGILAIAAKRLGAARVTGTDIDPQALMASAANAARNGVPATFVRPDDLPPATYQVVVANILANPLIVLAPALAGRVAPGGTLLLSGVLAEQAEEVAAAYDPWFRIRPWRQEDGWVALVGRRTLP